MVCRAQQQATAAVEGENGAVATDQEDADVPTPVVKIDNQHDPFATVVTIEYGNRLGELLDTVRRSPLVSCMHSRQCMHGMCSHPVVKQIAVIMPSIKLQACASLLIHGGML